jgi:hypothetical protein
MSQSYLGVGDSSIVLIRPSNHQPSLFYKQTAMLVRTAPGQQNASSLRSTPDSYLFPLRGLGIVTNNQVNVSRRQSKVYLRKCLSQT